MKSIREVLNRLKWDPSFDFSKVEIVYVDRAIPSGVSVMRGEEVEDIGHKFLFLKGDIMIPMHRIIEIRYEGKVFWKR